MEGEDAARTVDADRTEGVEMEAGRTRMENVDRRLGGGPSHPTWECSGDKEYGSSTASRHDEKGGKRWCSHGVP